MLFRKEIEKYCIYCKHAGRIDDDTMICKKKGLVSACEQCHHFSYDPLKRIPAPPAKADFSKYDTTDFSL